MSRTDLQIHIYSQDITIYIYYNIYMIMDDDDDDDDDDGLS